jgi:hypothetical protein
MTKTYQLKINLTGAKPPIWRRILIPSDIPLSDFHNVLQIVMGWENTHMHLFMSKDKMYGMVDPDLMEMEMLEEGEFKLSQLLKKENDALTYEYDFGDGWEHKILLEKVLPIDSNAPTVRCIKATGACPPEDIGGLWGFYAFLEAIADTNHPEHRHYIKWHGEFDPKKYNIGEVNSQLKDFIG